MTIEDEIRMLTDKQAITEVLYRYCYARDTGDLELSLGVWHPDGTALYEGLFEGPFQEFLDHPVTPGSTHSLSNVLIEIEGDHATSRSCVTSVSPIAEAQMLFIMRGRFVDRWSRREGVWAIDHRHYTTDSTQMAPMNLDGLPTGLPADD